MSWPPPQHPADAYAPDTEPGSAEDLLAETIESVIWHVFRMATVAQVKAVTRDVKHAAIQFAEAWQTSTPRRQIHQRPPGDPMDDLEAKLHAALYEEDQ